MQSWLENHYNATIGNKPGMLLEI